MKTHRFRSARSSLAAGVVVFLASALSLGAAEGYALTLEGETINGGATAISPEGQVTIGGKTTSLDALRFIAPGAKPGEAELQADESPLRILLICGSDLRAKNLIFDEENFTFDSASAGKEIEIPVDSVRAVRLALPIEGSRFEKTLALEADQRKDDTVYVTGVAGELLELSCLIESISADTVSFDRNGKKEVIDRDKVHGVILASPDLDEPMPCRAIMDDRSSFAGKVTSLSDGQLKLAMIDDVEVTVPWENVRRLRIYSPLLVALSDLTPERVVTQPILAPKWEFRRNKSVAGNELTLGDTIFDNGLGLAAGMKVTYQLDGDFHLFTATIGIDAETKRRGDCEFVVRGDGRELFRQRMRGKDEPALIKVDVTDVRQLEISVDPGENLDLGDHADWAEASLLQQAK